MKWLRHDESVSLCICLLTVACNREIQHLFLLAIRCKKKKKKKKKDFRFGLNLTVPVGSGRVGSDDLGYGPGLGLILRPVQTSNEQAASAPAQVEDELQTTHFH